MIASLELTRLWVWGICGLIIASGLFFLASRVSAAEHSVNADQHFVTIYDQGVEQTIITKARTVKGALDQAKITLEPSDAVEPAVDEELLDKSYRINIYRARPVLILDGARRERVMTAEQSPRQIIESMGATLYDEDTADFERIDSVMSDGGAGLKLRIDRATAFQFTLYGKTFEARSQALTVGAMLKEKNVILGTDDGSSVALDTPLISGMSISVWRNGKQTITQEEVIAKPIEQVQDTARDIGFREVRTPGAEGKKQVTYEIEMRDGVEVARKVITSVVSLEPVKEVIVVGAKMSNTFSGSFAEALARLRSCEGSYTSNTGNGYYGAYQYDIQTWGGYMGYPNASVAPPAVQDQKVWETYQRRGWQPWPSCKVKMGLQDIYR